jgi:drug/metabolite transporter (DMT)-like permease
MKPVHKANLYLLCVSIIWGATFPIIRNAVAEINPFLFVGLRFLLGSFLLVPVLGGSLRTTNKKILISCALLGLINGAAYATQTIGLQTVASARAAFITGLSVVLIPLFAPFFKLGHLTFLDMLCSLICLFGLYVLTGANLHGITYGDAWVAFSSVLTALVICYLQRLSFDLKDHASMTLAFYVVLFSAPLPLLFSIHANFAQVWQPAALFGLLFCALAATSFVFYIQATYQRLTTVPKAALIYALEPVFAALFGYLINGEPITYHMLVGGLIILASLTLAPLLQLTQHKPMV